MEKKELMQTNSERGFLELARRILKIARRKIPKDKKAEEIAAVLAQLVEIKEEEQGISIEHTLKALQEYITKTVTPQNMVGTTVYDYDTLYGIFSLDSSFTVGYEETSWLNEKATLRECNTNNHLVDQYRINVLEDKNILWRNELPFTVNDQESYALPLSSLVPESFIVDYGKRKVMKGNVIEDLQTQVNVYLGHDKDFVKDVFTRTRSK